MISKIKNTSISIRTGTDAARSNNPNVFYLIPRRRIERRKTLRKGVILPLNYRGFIDGLFFRHPSLSPWT